MGDADETPARRAPSSLASSGAEQGVRPLGGDAPGRPDLESAIARYRGTKVFVPWPGKTLFEHFKGFELDLRPALPPGDLDAGLIVVSFPHSGKPPRLVQVFTELAGIWTDDLRRAVIERRVRIVLDASPEAYPPGANRMEPTRQGLERLGAPIEAAIWVTQDRGYDAQYADYRAGRGLRDGLRVLNYDYWIRRFHRQFETRGKDLYPARLAAFEARPRTRGRRFISLNMTLRPSKLLFLLSVIRDGLWDDGYISCGGLFKKASNFDGVADLSLTEDYFAHKLNGLTAFGPLKDELLPYFSALEAKGQVILGDVARDGQNGLPKQSPIDPMLREYDDCWLTAVTETEMRPRRSRVTEKSFGALVNFQPMVVFGNPGALGQVRELGYLTFGDAIDETYDEIEDPGRRFTAAYAEFYRLCRMEEAELARTVDRLREVLVFNAEWGMTRLPRIYRERIDLAFLDALFEFGSAA